MLKASHLRKGCKKQRKRKNKSASKCGFKSSRKVEGIPIKVSECLLQCLGPSIIQDSKEGNKGICDCMNRDRCLSLISRRKFSDTHSVDSTSNNSLTSKRSYDL